MKSLEIGRLAAIAALLPAAAALVAPPSAPIVREEAPAPKRKAPGPRRAALVRKASQLNRSQKWAYAETYADARAISPFPHRPVR